MELKDKLRKCLQKAYGINATEYVAFSLEIIDRYSNKFGGEYIPENKLLLIQKDESNCSELEIATGIHELSHHVEYIKYGYTKHDTKFHEIQKELLISAFKLKFLQPSKLKLAEQFLSRYSERRRIISVCDSYMKQNKVNQFQLEITYFKEKGARGFEYSPILDGYYKFEPLGKKDFYLTKKEEKR